MTIVTVNCVTLIVRVHRSLSAMEFISESKNITTAHDVAYLKFHLYFDSPRLILPHT